jgi:predicted AAA+ superfamily ATPase
MMNNLLRILIRPSIQLVLSRHFTDMIDIHDVFAAHIGNYLDYREIARIFLINQNYHRATENYSKKLLNMHLVLLHGYRWTY